jgi:AmmeMemoRadiSam system protein B
MLPRLRGDLDFMPSPVPDRPGLLIRDPYQYSDTTLILPPVMAACLEFFDGRCSELDLRQALVEATGDLRVSEIVQQLCGALTQAGFCDDENYARMKAERQARFAEAPEREPAHAGSAYPLEPSELRAAFGRYLDGHAAEPAPLAGMAAPHVSPEGGWRSYAAAYAALGPQYRDRTFVIVGTSHYGEPERFGLTRKPFVTPLGVARTNRKLVDCLVEHGGPAVRLEDYCHAVEHSIEFQVVFLQHVFGPDIEILPVLVGPFARSLYQGGRPEDDEGVRRFFDALGEVADRERDGLFWVLGVDMAHMGRRYGDPFPAQAGAGELLEVEARDRGRIERLCSGDAGGFWNAVQEQRDPLKWCGAAPLYTFLKAAPGTRGRLLRYEQWNIDPQSVVSFAALAFSL